MIRIGFGYDCHRFTQGDHLVIGGEKIPFHQGIEAHSDGDVLLHAVCDALLGAAGLGDIGRHYPNTDPQFRDIKSALLLERVARKIEEENYITGNVDSTIILEAPKLAEHICAMQINIGKVLKISATNVNVKATTNEGMGFIGRGEGIAAYAVVTLLRQNCCGENASDD